MKISPKENIQMPMKTVASLITMVAIGTWAFFGIQEKLNQHATTLQIMEKDLVENTEFRIKWPRGDLGSLPADSEQFMLIEHLAGEFEKLQDEIDTGKAPHDQQQALTLEFYEKRITSLETRIEALRDQVAHLKANGGNNQ